MAKTISICGALDPEACPASDFGTLHACSRAVAHADGMKHPAHDCVCGHRWLVPVDRKPKRDLADLVRHIVVTEVRPGDLLVFETDCRMSDVEMEAFQNGIREGVSKDLQVIVVERGRFAGVIRDDAHAPPRMVDVSSVADLAAGRQTLIPAERAVTVVSCRHCNHDIFQRSPETGWLHRMIGHCARPEPRP